MFNTTVQNSRPTLTLLRHAVPESSKVQTPALPNPRIRRACLTETTYRWGTAALLFSSGAVAARLLLWMGQ